MTTTSERLGFNNQHVLLEVAGELGSHLAWVSKILEISAQQRGDELVFESDNGNAALAANLFGQLARMAESGRSIHRNDVRDGLRILRSDASGQLESFFRDTIIIDLKKRPITPRTPNQQRYVAALREADIVFGVGPAGTGKTFLAMAVAVANLKKGDCKKIILTRPAVEAGERLGFLPGDLSEKIDPYLRPLFDALGEMMDRGYLERLLERGVIEVAPLAFMRGRTLNDAYVVLDEAQNTTVEQMKMFLTRLGDRGRMVITGDASQVDLPHGRRSGLAHALHVLRDVAPIRVVRMSSEDVVRHPLVGAIIDAYEGDEQQRANRDHR